MPSYICEKCGCIDNSACGGNYWSVKSKLNLFADEYSNTHLLCVECTPQKFSDGSINHEAGIWHNHFPKKHWSDIGKQQILNASDDLGSYTNAKDYFDKYFPVEIKEDLWSILNMYYNSYIMEDDEKLDESGRKLKESLKVVFDDLELHDGIEIKR